MVLAAFDNVANFRPLSPLTDDPAEWMERSEFCDGEPMWQSKRNACAFSVNGGLTYYLVGESPPVIYATASHGATPDR